jgi:hypothetical protein
MRLLPEPDWFAFLRVGDVLRSPSGALRVVRLVSRREGRLTAVCFAIRRCSWTRRPLTVYNRYDLKRGWSHVGARVRLDSELDRKIARSHTLIPPEYEIRCCDVVGLVP